MDSDFKLNKQINSVVKSVFYQLRLSPPNSSSSYLLFILSYTCFYNNSTDYCNALYTLQWSFTSVSDTFKPSNMLLHTSLTKPVRWLISPLFWHPFTGFLCILGPILRFYCKFINPLMGWLPLILLIS